MQMDNKLKEILAEPTRFLQCGSRWFADRYPDIIQISDQTDWDFYCLHTDSNIKILDELGFKCVAENKGCIYPLDDLAVSIYMRCDVQVITRTDTAKYAKTLLHIDPLFYRDFLWKSGPKRPERSQIQCILNQLFKM